MSIRPRKLSEYGEILWRRKLVIIIVAAVMLKASFTIIERIPDKYESRASLVVIGQLLEGAQSHGTQISLVTQHVVSHANLVELARRYQLQQPEEDEDRSVQRLRKEVKLDTKLREYYPQVPESLSLSFRHPDPKVAQQVLSDIVAQFRDINETLKQRAELEERQLNEEIAELDASLLKFGRAAGTPATISPPINNNSAASRPDLLAAIDTLSDKQVMLERQISDQRQQIVEQEKLTKLSVPAAGARAGSSYGLLLLRKTELEAQLKDFATQYTEKNAKVIQARSQLAEVDRQLARLETDDSADIAAKVSPEARELRALQRDLNRLETEQELTRRELERKRRALTNLPARSSQGIVGSVARAGLGQAAMAESDRLNKRYARLMDRQEALRKERANIGGGAQLFQVVDPPHLPKTPVAPNRLLLKLLALALALAGGVLLVAAIELPQLFFIKNSRDVEFYLGALLLGLILETLTPVENSRMLKQRLARGFILLLLAAALLPACVLLLSRLQVFQMFANR